MNKEKRSYQSKNSNSLNAMIKKTSMNFQRQNINGKKLLMTTTTVAIILSGIFVIGFGDEMMAFAAKPLKAIYQSNGMPSGPHFNLNILGKSSFDSTNCNGDGGKAVFTPEYSDMTETISMYANKKAESTDLVVRDPCTESFDSDAAQVQIPTHLETDEGKIKLEDGFWVFARVHGKPTNDNGETSNIALFPKPQVEACDLIEDPNSGTADDCVDSNGNPQEFVSLGYVTSGGYYKCPDLHTCTGESTLERYSSTTGKGVNKATDITGLFEWTGVGCLDPDGDEEITFADFTDVDVSGNVTAGDMLVDSEVLQEHIDAAEIMATGSTNDGSIVYPSDEFDALLIVLGQDDDFAACAYEAETWVFDVFDADLVIQNYTLVNEGSKNLQLRFYPQETTLWK